MRDFIILTRRHILFTALIVVVLLACAGAGFWMRAYHSTFFPGIYIGREEVAGRSFDEVLARFKLVADALKTNGLELSVPTDHATTTVTIPAQTVGLTPDVVVEYFTIGDYESVVREAFAIGRQGSLWRRLSERASTFFKNRAFSLPIVVRDTAIESLLDRELHAVLRQPKDAYIIYGAAGVAIVPETTGESVALAPVVRGVHDALSTLKTNRLRLGVTVAKAAITADRLEAIKDFAASIAQGSGLTLEYRGADVRVGAGTLASWITRSSRDQIEIAVRREQLENFIRRHINDRIDDRPQNSRFTMRDGVLIEIVPGMSGSVAELDRLVRDIEDELNKRYLASLFGGVSMSAIGAPMRFPIVFTTADPLITAQTVGGYKIHELVGSATTSYRGSTASRKHNIATGAEKINGVLIAPGEEFSLVTALGDVSEEAGYEKEYVIKGDRSVKEAGGGLCQVATTVFRAALNAGLPITERTNHSYVVGYYGPGLDATIYGPWPDLKFINDTPGYLLFQMRTQGDNLLAEFYGQKDAREASITAPKLFDYIDPPPDRFIPAPDKPWGALECTDHARKGLTAEVAYTVQYADGRVQNQLFTSVYQPWPKICLVGIQVPSFGR